jgi:hypothetical protein
MYKYPLLIEGFPAVPKALQERYAPSLGDLNVTNKTKQNKTNYLPS